MKTYAETKGIKSFDWWEALNNPPIIGSNKYHDLLSLACSWVTCACGNQCDIIPRYKDGTPKDHELAILGTEFSINIDECDWELAKETLTKIEKKSSQLINELTK